ncbi:hypothetical protein CY35_10G001100 [Sphagnum magellanicum]|nr:hypothetical protein CY35_10G001100 [Sphagnum magellanicum]
MKLTVLTADERIVSLDVEPDELVENLKALLEVETQVPLVQQQLLFNGKEVQNTMRLNAVGVGEDDLLMLVSAPTPSSAGGPAPSDLALNSDGSAVNPIALQRHLRGDPNVMSQLQQNNPELAQAILSDDTEVLQMLLRRQHQHRVELQRRQQQELDLMNADPFDVDAQRKIEEAIRQKNVDENWEAAIEYNPEAFARVIMLYVDMEVNGVPLKAFVDSGAQSTIISKTCAERCGLLRLMDRRYVGIAKGVGQSEIVGRIHVAPLKIGTNFYPCSFTVLDQADLEFIFGLDMLRKHQCSIDLKDNVLRVGGGEIAVPFLQERDLPMHLHDDKRLEELPPATGASSSTVNLHTPAPVHAPTDSSTQDTNKRARSAEELSQTEAKVQRLVELGFDRRTVIQALTLFNGNEEQAASYLFGGF